MEFAFVILVAKNKPPAVRGAMANRKTFCEISKHPADISIRFFAMFQIKMDTCVESTLNISRKFNDSNSSFHQWKQNGIFCFHVIENEEMG